MKRHAKHDNRMNADSEAPDRIRAFGHESYSVRRLVDTTLSNSSADSVALRRACADAQPNSGLHYPFMT